MIDPFITWGLDLLKQYGLIGLVVAFMGYEIHRLNGVIATLRKDLEGCWEARLRSKETLVQTVERVTSTLATLIAENAGRLKLLEEIQRGAQEILHQGTNTLEHLKGVRDRVDKLVDRK